MRITNENNQHVGVSLSDSSELVNNAAGYKANVDTVTVNDHSSFSLYDTVYNANKRFVGVITGIAANTLYFNRGTHIPLVNGEKLFLPHSDLRTDIFSSSLADESSTTIDIDDGSGGNSDATSIFSVGDKVYLGNGCTLGVLSNVTATQLTFESGISISVPDNVRMYKESALPRVFASNTKSNRIILELVFMPR